MAAPNPLASWLAPLELETFCSDYLSKRVLFREARRERLGALAGAHSWSVDELLRGSGVKALAWFEAVDGRHLTADVSIESARKLYAGGVTLYLQDVPELGPVGDAIAGALAVPRQNIKCTLFCNRPGATTRAHFDPIDTITLQLTGSKRWRVAPNALAPAPTTSWATLDGSEKKAELWLYGHDELPTGMPAGAEEFVLEPGAMLHVPRGYWHETVSNEESVSLHIHHVPLPWVDAVLVSLRGLLLRDRAWREGANRLWDAAQNGVNTRALEPLLDSLAEAARRLSVDDVLPAPGPSAGPAGPRSAMLRRARAGFVVEGRAPGAETARVTFVVADYGSERRTTVEMSDAFLEACRLFVDSPEGGPFSATDLVERVPGLDTGEAERLVGLLLDVGFLRRA